MIKNFKSFINESVGGKYGEKFTRLFQKATDFEVNSAKFEIVGDSDENGPAFTIYVKPTKSINIKCVYDGENDVFEPHTVCVLVDLNLDKQVRMILQCEEGDLRENEIETIDDEDFENLLTCF